MWKVKEFPCGCKLDVNVDSNGKIVGVDWNPDKTNLNCQKTWDMVCNGKTGGVFQLETFLGKSYAKKFKPRSIEEWSDLIAGIRPGCLDAEVDGKNMANHYADRKSGRDEVVYEHPALEPILKETYGINLYQESSMKIAAAIAGYTLPESYSLLKAIGKKKADLMAKHKTKFLEGAIKHGLSAEEAERVFDNIESSQRYAFNRCISGNERLLRASKSHHAFHPTVAEMFLIRNSIEYAKSTGHLSLYKKWKLRGDYGYGLSLNDDGRVRQNIIKNISYAGCREVFLVTLENGATIKVTNNHKFPTPNGNKTLQELKVGDILYYCEQYIKLRYRSYNFSDMSTKDRQPLLKCNTGNFYGKFGEQNSGYINGQYTLFKTNKYKLDTDKCGICYCTPTRIETHHIDGDRSNNDISNLINLCPSCHKKEDYKLGRIRRGERGYLSSEIKIASIESIGMENVYDVTMDAPYHTFVNQDRIITCNSHSVAYSINGYIYSAYPKAHFPKVFYATQLDNGDLSKRKENDIAIADIIEDGLAFGVRFAAPDIRYCNTHAIIDGDTIIPGLAKIKYMNEAIVKTLPHKPISYYQFLYKHLYNMQSRAVEALILSGATAFFGFSRQQQLFEVKDILKHLSQEQVNFLSEYDYPLLKGLIAIADRPTGRGQLCYNITSKKKIERFIEKLENPPFKLDDNCRLIANWEREYIGREMTCTELDVPGVHDSYNCINCQFVENLNGAENTLYNLPLIVKSFNEFKTKSGGKMCFLRGYDISGAANNIGVFSDVYYKFRKHIYTGNKLLLRGSFSKDIFVVREIIEI